MSSNSTKAAFADMFAAPDMVTGAVAKQESLSDIRKKAKMSRADLKKKDLEKEFVLPD